MLLIWNLHLQAGALEVLGTLLTTLPLPQSQDLLSSSMYDDDCELEDMSTVVQEVWLAAVGVLSQVVVHNPRGSKQILQVQYCIIATVPVCALPSKSEKSYMWLWSAVTPILRSSLATMGVSFGRVVQQKLLESACFFTTHLTRHI